MLNKAGLQELIPEEINHCYGYKLKPDANIAARNLKRLRWCDFDPSRSQWSVHCFCWMQPSQFSLQTNNLQWFHLNKDNHSSLSLAQQSVSWAAMVVLSGSCRVISCLVHIRSLHTKGWAKRKQITFREALAMQPHRATCCCQPTNRLKSSSSPPQQTG